MKYLSLIQSNEKSLAVWETLSEQQRIDFGRGHRGLSEEMEAAGVLVSSAGLADPARASRVFVRDGKAVVSDGPFAEAKEHLAGFYLIDVDSPQEAFEWAAKVPDAATIGVEVRPVLDMSGWEI